jgi:FkbM family methyltransferase
MSKANYKLPNGQPIHQLNLHETDFIFHEIFVEEIYLQHGITLPVQATVFDIGANIGLFSLYIKHKFPSSKLYAFEPIPEIYQLLCLNVAAFASTIHTYNFGLFDQITTLPFDYYPGCSVMSGLQVKRPRATEILTTGMQSRSTQDQRQITALVKQRLASHSTWQCQVTTLSTMLRHTQSTKVDLLKIDVEGAELSVLKGIIESDWPKIRQIVLEVHNPDDLPAIMMLLKAKHFKVHIEADRWLKSAGIYNVFAMRGEN